MIGWVWSVTVGVAAPLSADELVRAALAEDPAVAAAEAEVVAAKGRWAADRGLRSDPIVEARVGFGVAQHEIGVSQALSLSGEGLHAAASARFAVEAAEATLARRQLEVAATARLAAIAVLAAVEDRDRAVEALRLSRVLRGGAEQRLAAGEGAALEVHLARLEEASADATRVRAERAVWDARASLAARTGLAADVDLGADPWAFAPEVGDAGARVDLVAAEAAEESARRAVQRERAATIPRVEVGVWAQAQNLSTSVGPEGVETAPWAWSENVGWSFGPSIAWSIPIASAWRGEVARAQGDLSVIEASRAALVSQVEAEWAFLAARRAMAADAAAPVDAAREARAALAAVDSAVAAGEMATIDAALLRARILDAWGRAAGARAGSASARVELALIESWPTLLPGAP